MLMPEPVLFICPVLHISDHLLILIMKLQVHLIAGLFFCQLSQAQYSDTAMAAIYYNLRNMPDSATPKIFRNENMVLYIGNSMNIFLSYDKLKKDSASANGYEPSKNSKPVIHTQIVSNRTSRQLVVQEYLFRNYYYTTPFPEIRWSITNEKKQVGGYLCTKAEGYYKGRTYHAWFTTETKLQGAPWKLTGLPGLVLEAYDTRRQVNFELIKMETDLRNRYIISSPPANASAITRKDFISLRESAWNDPVAAFNASNPGHELNITNGNGLSANIRLPRPANPLELVDD